MKVILISIVLILFVFNAYSQEANAAKILPQSKLSKKAVSKKFVGTGVIVTPKLRSDRKALLVYFGNLQNAKSVSYMLIYKTSGQQEGAGGSINTSEGNTASRELLFGTCSKNVCRYHTNLSSVSFEVRAQLKSGKNLLRRYKIRV